ncbi:thioredoxin family protein [Anaerobaca lacustris]|uniref:Thioredoxin family protein n=1 Tax=Anaerobaca lacustris TaxID=3044600 RepID=A0AAW6TQK8_9BACT|nr:thioredoxin family protein [Sedimentisphaerales bacterium M17dextr]
MSATASTMLPLGTKAMDFSLPDIEGRIVSLSDFSEGQAMVVVFMCNHCPFVKHVIDGLVDLVGDYQGKGVAFIAINANDVETYPDDRPEKMAEFARQKGFTFPYLYDQTQEVAKAYHAACTPDFFVFDGDRDLVYRGQMDDSRPGNNEPVTGADLRTALDAVLEGRPAPDEQRPSMGCNIKWQPGNEPDYA